MLPVVRRSPGAFVFALQSFADQRNTLGQSAIKVVIPKVRLDVILGDIKGGRVRDRSFGAVSRLDEHLSVAGENEKHHPVIDFLLADAPRLGDAPGVVGDIRIALHFRINRDDNLAGSVAFKLRELVIQPGCRPG